MYRLFFLLIPLTLLLLSTPSARNLHDTASPWVGTSIIGTTGVSSTGNVTAVKFYGDGANLTGVVASSESTAVIRDVDTDTYVTTEATTDSDTITFFTGGSQKAVFLTTGSLGIGTATPGYLLHVNGSMSGASITATTATITTGSAGYLTITTLELGLGMTDAQQASLGTALGLRKECDVAEDKEIMCYDPDLEGYAGLDTTPVSTNIVFLTPAGLTQVSTTTAQTMLGLEPGTHVQAYHLNLQDISGITRTAGHFVTIDSGSFTGVSTATVQSKLGLASMAYEDDGAVSIDGGTLDNVAITNSSFGGTYDNANINDLANLTPSGTNKFIYFDGADYQEASDSTQRTQLGLGSMALEDDGSVSIDGGTLAGVAITASTIDSTAIGGTTSSTAKFVYLTSAGLTSSSTISGVDVSLTGDITAVTDITASGDIQASGTISATVGFSGDGSSLTNLPAGVKIQDVDTYVTVSDSEGSPNEIHGIVGGSVGFTVLSSGGFGIGTQTPGKRLTVNGEIEASDNISSTGTITGTTISGTALITSAQGTFTNISGNGTGIGGVVHTATNEYIEGSKVFASVPISNDIATTDGELVRLGQTGSMYSQESNNVNISGGNIQSITVLTATSATLTATLSAGTVSATTFTASNVAITGGSINDTAIGNTTRSSGQFTTLDANSGITGTLNTNAQPNITSLGTLGSVDIDGGDMDGVAIGANTSSTAQFQAMTAVTVNIDGGTLDGTAIGSATRSSGQFTTLDANSGITGTLNTSAQPNVTSLGTLASVDINGGFIDGTPIGQTVQSNAKFGTATATLFEGTSANISGNVTAGSFSGDGSNLTGVSSTPTATDHLIDADQDTYIKVEQTADEDRVHVVAGASEKITVLATAVGINMTPGNATFEVNGTARINGTLTGSGIITSGTGTFTTLNTGSGHSITGDDGAVSGGSGNTINTNDSTISAGTSNTVTADSSFIGGGAGNTVGESAVSDTHSGIIGGASNLLRSRYSFIGAGSNNTILNGDQNAVLGGDNNNIESAYSVILGGLNNHMDNATGITISGGTDNSLTQSNYSAISAGEQSIITEATSSAIIAGDYVQVSGNYSVAGGRRGHLADDNTLAWLSGDADADRDAVGNNEIVWSVNGSGQVTQEGKLTLTNGDISMTNTGGIADLTVESTSSHARIKLNADSDTGNYDWYWLAPSTANVLYLSDNGSTGNHSFFANAVAINSPNAPAHTLHVAGTFNATGNISTDGNVTGNSIISYGVILPLPSYGGMGVPDGSTAQFTISTGGVYVATDAFTLSHEKTGFLTDSQSNTDHSTEASDGFIVDTNGAGKYKFTFQASATGSANTEFKFFGHKNGTKESFCGFTMEIGSTSDIERGAVSCFLTLAVGDFVDVRYTSNSNNDTLTLHNTSFSLVRVDN